jgi:hypothetical protein
MIHLSLPIKKPGVKAEATADNIVVAQAIKSYYPTVILKPIRLKKTEEFVAAILVRRSRDRFSDLFDELAAGVPYHDSCSILRPSRDHHLCLQQRRHCRESNNDHIEELKQPLSSSHLTHILCSCPHPAPAVIHFSVCLCFCICKGRFTALQGIWESLDSS